MKNFIKRYQPTRSHFDNNNYICLEKDFFIIESNQNNKNSTNNAYHHLFITVTSIMIVSLHYRNKKES